MAEEILGHNLEDVLGLGRIFEMLGYLCIYDSKYEVTYAEFDDENLILELTLPRKLPQKFSNGNEQFYLTGERKNKIYYQNNRRQTETILLQSQRLLLSS